MLLYKYLGPDRADVLKARRIRFTQPGDLNDPTEFAPAIQAVASDEIVRDYTDQNLESFIEQELAKYGPLAQFIPQHLKKQVIKMAKEQVPIWFRATQAQLVPEVASRFRQVIDQHIGVLCLSEVANSELMWGHYTVNHAGFVIGFDSENEFFSRKRSKADEFGFLRKVEYRNQRPQVTLTNTNSHDWFQVKSDKWAYEREHRIAQVLKDANFRIEHGQFPICLFDFPISAVKQIILGLRASPSLKDEIKGISNGFPSVELLQVFQSPSEYDLMVKPLN